MTYEILNLYKDLKSKTGDLIRNSKVDGLDDDEKEIEEIISKIESAERDPWLTIAKRLKVTPKIYISQEQKDFLINMGVNIWTNGAVEIFWFNDNFTFIPVVNG